MQDGDYELNDELFYLCGVGTGNPQKTNPSLSLRQTNVHLAVQPRKGSRASIGSVYGVTFIIEDAQQIPIVPPHLELRGKILDLTRSKFPDLAAKADELADAHYRCKMFQFGYQMFETCDEDFTTGVKVDKRKSTSVAFL